MLQTSQTVHGGCSLTQSCLWRHEAAEAALFSPVGVARPVEQILPVAVLRQAQVATPAAAERLSCGLIRHLGKQGGGGPLLCG